MSRMRWRTGIGRPLDFRYRSNRFVAIASVIAGLATFAWRWSSGSDEIIVWSFQVAGAVFLAWAIARELDPDDPSPATVATVLVLPFMVLGPPSLAASAAALLAIRIAARTTGLSPQGIDAVFLTLAAAYLGSDRASWPALAASIVAVGTDRFAEPPGPARTLWFGAAMTLAAAIGAVTFPGSSVWTPPTRPEWVVLGATLAAAFLAVVTTRPPRSRGDFQDDVLSQPRLRSGRVLVLFTLVMGAIARGGPATHALAPLWAAALGVAIVIVARRGRRERTP
jgi:hypothetical protein